MDWRSRLSELTTIAPRLKVVSRRLKKSPAGPYLRKLAERARQLGLVSAASRFVLTLGDEGAALVQFRGNRVVDAIFVGPDAEDGLATLKEILDRDPQAEVVVSADVLEQMYRVEELPRVGRFDRLTIVKRRLDIAFPHDQLKAALPLEGGSKGTNRVLFSALPVSSTIEKWIEFLEALPNPVIGFALLPLESADLAANLAPSAEGEQRRVWRAWVSQQAASGFRQIFEVDGELAVTRLSARPPGDLTAEGAALLIERELRSSISYIKRLGYTDFDRLDLVVVGNPELCAAVEARELPVTSVTALTPRQASAALDHEEVGPEDSPFADILHAQWLAARRPKLLLPTETLRHRLKVAAAFKAGFVGATVLSVGAIFYVGSMIFDAIDNMSTIETLEGQIKTEQQSVSLARKKVQGFPIPVEDVTLVAETDQLLAGQQISPLPFFQDIAGALDPSVRVQKISFAVPGAGAAGSGPGTPPAAQPGRGTTGLFGLAGRKPAEVLYEIHLTLQFVGDTTGAPDALLQHAKEFRERLAKAFPGYEVTAVQLPGSQLRTQVLEGTAASGPRGIPSGPPTGEYLIRKRA